MERDVFGQDGLLHTMPHEERETPQVGRIWDLLVKTHPGYDEFRVTTGGWWAMPKRNVPSPLPRCRHQTVYVAAPFRTLSWHSLTSSSDKFEDASVIKREIRRACPCLFFPSSSDAEPYTPTRRLPAFDRWARISVQQL